MCQTGQTPRLGCVQCFPAGRPEGKGEARLKSEPKGQWTSSKGHNSTLLTPIKSPAREQTPHNRYSRCTIIRSGLSTISFLGYSKIIHAVGVGRRLVLRQVRIIITYKRC